MSARELKERGNAHYVRKQYAQAAEWYSKALAADPSAVPVYTNRAAAHFAAGRFEESAADARAAVERDGGWVKGWYRLGLCLERLERFKAAAEALQKGLDADSSNTQVKEALERCLAAAAALPSDAPAAKAKGNEAYKNGQYEEAAKWYTFALDLLPDGDEESDAVRVTLLTNRAEAFRQQALYERVIADCDAALALDVNAVKAYMRRALAREALGLLRPAREDFKAAVERAPGTPLASQGLRRVTQALEHE